MNLLLVEDDASMRATLARALGRRGWLVRPCEDGEEALVQWRAAPPDVVVLDLSLPGLDGLQVLERARAAGLAQPVLILTARGTVGDRILGLNAGADDYLPKPFDLDELEARLKALGRRGAASPPGTGPGAAGAPTGSAIAGPAIASLGALEWDRDSGAFYHQGQVLELTPREAALLQALMARPGQAMAKERLFERVFPGASDVQHEAVEVVVYRLRKKLAPTGVELVTLRGLGYLLKASASA
jgi:two-component system response regulator TctD